MFINDFLKEVERADIGIQLECGIFDDFIGVSDSK